MANEIIQPFDTGKVLYFNVFNRVGQVWNTGSSSFESYQTANYSSYKVTMTEQGAASGIYEGSFPSAITAGVYNIIVHSQPGGSPAEGDPKIGVGTEQWNGTATAPLSDTATSGQVGQGFPERIARGTMINNYPIYLKSSADHVTPFVSGVVSGQIARDNGSFGPLQSGAFTEKGLGFYTLQALTSGDLLGNTISLLFTANGISGGSSDPLPISIITQRVSGF